MKRPKINHGLAILIFSLFLLASCKEPIERSGVVVDGDTQQPIEGVEIDIYMKYQKRDSLKQDVITDKNGHFTISEKHDIDQMFQLRKPGYIGFVSSLKAKGDTIRMEKE